jgi:hypothetical protein
MSRPIINADSLFGELKNSLLNIDPVAWAENYLTLDGKPFSLHGNGYKPYADLYRYIGIKALEPNAKPLILVKGRQTAGTTLANVMELYFACSGLFGTNSKPPIRIMHVFPQRETAEKYSKEKLNTMISSSLQIPTRDKKQITRSYIQTLLDQNSDTGDSLKFKLFKGGNFIRVDSTSLSGDRLRGGTADVIFFDEVQDIPAEAIGNTVEILKQAQYGRQPGGVQVFFGTPKRKGSDFFKMWNVSSQQYYYLGCLKCKGYFPLYTPESEDWKKIWIHGFIVKCPHCQYEQDKREAAEHGKWIATRDINDPDIRMVGFFINQFFMPKMKREDIDAEMPANHPTNTERKFQNEVLGEFYQGDATPISPEEIVLTCGDRERGLRARIMPGEEQLVVLGLDYGAKSDLEHLANPDKAKGGQSYTTACVLSVKGPNLFNVDLALKFTRNDPEHKKGVIENIMRQYSVNLAIGDIGFSNDFSHTLHTIYGDRYLVSRAHNKINDKVKFNPDAFPKEIIFERDWHITDMYELLKKGQIKFPLKNYDSIAWAIEHCCNMELKPSISRMGGDPEIHYVKSGPNDFAMALINALLAYRFYITQGFKIKNPNLMREPKKRKEGPLAVLGNITRKF